MTKILISGFIGSENLGDEAILKSILANLDVDPADITAISVNPAKTEKLGIKAKLAKRPQELAQAIRECDIFLVGGGGILQDQTSILNFLYYMFQLAVAKRHAKTVILTFVGVGPIKYRLSKAIFKRLVPSVHLAVVRDHASAEQLAAHGLPEDRIVTAHDPVLNFSSAELRYENPYADDSPYMVVSLRRWFFTNPLLPVFITRRTSRLPVIRRRYDQYIKNVARDLDVVLQKNPRLSLVFVPFNIKEDLDVIADVRSAMTSKEQILDTPTSLDEAEYLALVADAELLFGMRLHSLILAATQGTPFVGLQYSLKVEEFIKQMGMENRSVHIDSYDSDQMIAAVESTLASRDEVHNSITAIVGDYQEQNLDAFATLNKALVQSAPK